MSWIAYTDGGAAPSNPGPAAWGAVIISPEKVVQNHKGFIGHGTNQIAELTAAIEGLSLIPAGAKVELVSDSQYVLKGLTEWRKGWEKNGMRNSKKELVANLDLWKRLYEVADARIVVTRWIKGHSGDKYNEQADVLVGEALASARSNAARG
ncbi:MAG TPA: ribonuclease H [Burkholderiaceae bacterium]